MIATFIEKNKNIFFFLDIIEIIKIQYICIKLMLEKNYIRYLHYYEK